MMPVSVVIVDDHKIFRDGFKLLLKQFPFVQLIGEASNGHEFLELIENLKPDIVFMDINMPRLNGIEAARLALEINPEMKIIALTTFPDEEYVEQMLMAGVEGYMLKNSEIEEFEKAIKKIYKGGNYFSGEILAILSRNISRSRQLADLKGNLPDFSPREKEILHLLCHGYNNKQISELIHLNTKTIEKYKSILFRKTNCMNTVNLVIYAFKNQLADPNRIL